MKGRQLGRFVIKSAIKPGGHSMVWLADEQLSEDTVRPAAIKILQGMDVTSEEAIQKYRQEAETLVALSSAPNIVELRGFGIDEGLAWIAMEYLPHSLDDAIAAEPGDPELVRQMLGDVANGLHIMHESGILHRDIKPANIMQTSYGDYKIGDFGLAGNLVAETTMKTATVRYSPPELLDPSFSAELPASDLYSLGFVAYAMALGREKFAAEFTWLDPAEEEQNSPEEVRKWMSWHLSPNLTATPAIEHVPGLPARLSDTIAKLMAKPVEQRFESASALLDALDRPAAARPRAGAAPVASPRKSWWQENGRTVVLAGVLVMILAVVAAFLVFTSAPDPVIELAQREFCAAQREVAVAGQIQHLPKNATTLLRLDDGTRHPLRLDPAGGFRKEISLAEPGEMDGEIVVAKDAKVLARQAIRIVRLPPDAVRILLRTSPAAADARIQLIRVEDGVELDSPIKTNDQGRAEISAAPGKYRLTLEHERYELSNAERAYDTGFDPQCTLRAALRTRLGEVVLAIVPTNATVRLSGEDLVDEQILLDRGAARRELIPGSYTAAVAAEGYQPREEAFEIERGQMRRVALALVPEPTEEPERDKPADLETGPSWIELLSDDEFLAYLQKNVPLASVEFEQIPETHVFRAKGAVLNERELETLHARLAEASIRLEIEVRADPERSRQLLQQALREAGGEAVRVRVRGEEGAETLFANFDVTESLSNAQAREIAERYVFDASFVDVRGF